MRFGRVMIHGMGVLPDIDLDLGDIGGPLIAVIGPNGSGKTSFLEILAGGSCYRRTESRGTLAHLAVTRDAYIQSQVFSGGREWLIRQTIDGVSGKGESLVLDAAGRPAFESGKVTDFDVWSKANLLPPEIMFAGPFAVQGSKGFLGLGRADRMSVFVRMLGIERYEKMAKIGRDRAAAALLKMEALCARIDDARALAPGVADAESGLKAATESAAEASEKLATARSSLESARSAEEDVALAKSIRERRLKALALLHRVTANLAGMETRIANNRGLLARSDEIADAVTKSDEMKAQIAQMEEDQRHASESARVALSDRDRYGAAAARADAELDASERRQDSAMERLVDRAEIEQSVHVLTELRLIATQLAKELETLQGEVEWTRDQQLSHKDDRITGLRTTMEDARETFGADTMGAVLTTGLRADDTRIAAETGRPEEIAKLDEQIAEVVGRQRVNQRTTDKARTLAARGGELAAAQIELGEAIKLESAATQRQQNALLAQRNADEQAIKHTRVVTAFEKTLTEASDTLNRLASTVKLASTLESAKARIDELEIHRANADAQRAETEVEIAGLPDLEAPKDTGLDALEKHVNTHLAVEEATKRKVGNAEAQVESAQLGAKRIDAMEVELAKITEEHGDWVRLGQDLGRDGLQALEVDAAIPELNELATDLLRNCHGSRFTVEMRTDKLVDKGKSTREALDVRVIDSEKGRDDLAESYSPGELVIVGEAVADALTVLSCRHMGIERPHLIRDESGAALDPENRPAYVAMLRRSAEMINAAGVLFVSHDVAMQELADARIEIKDGKVEVVA